MGKNIENIVKVIDQDLIWKNILALLEKKYSVEFKGTNPYLLKLDSNSFYILIRNLTRAYPNSSPDVCRIQLHKSPQFHEIKKSDIPLVILGFCEQYNTVATWKSESVKPRLNGKGNISLYSRFSKQLPVENRLLRKFHLSNNDLITVSNFKNLDLLLFENLIDENYSSNKLELIYENNNEQTISNLLKNVDNELLQLIYDDLFDFTELNAIQKCIQYYEKNKMEYNLIIIKNVISKLKKFAISEISNEKELLNVEIGDIIILEKIDGISNNYKITTENVGYGSFKDGVIHLNQRSPIARTILNKKIGDLCKLENSNYYYKIIDIKRLN